MADRKYYNTFCEICGAVGNRINSDGWVTCELHRTSERPSKPTFVWNTGEMWGNREVERPWTMPEDEESS